ncbi:hypothetical protein JYU34_000793 [Plutella xylostella]|uniref:Uncharacterized protein n=1 Tax=Plutella xylostella TaxID=51655 RepID=A0ABQ7R8M6_PLUXY|nr:hypothetical protein JYU34_000793 [Plutella xylostella]
MDTTDVAPKDPRFALVIQYFKENESGSLADVLRYVKRKYRLGSREELTNVVESAVHSGAALGLFERKLAKAPSKPRIGTIRCSTHILPSQRCRCSSVKRRGLGNNKGIRGCFKIKAKREKAWLSFRNIMYL